MSSAPPAPQVEHLPTIFRKIRAGEYRVPPFQREFVWDYKQVIELLESVYRGFPIGSVLLWTVNKKTFKSETQQRVGFPLVADIYPTSFVLDGVQRLTTLFGVFASDLTRHDDRLEVYFDLESEEFFTTTERRIHVNCVPLNVVFSTRAFLDEQRRLASHEKGDLLLDRAVKLLSVFQEYMLPIVFITNSDPNKVVKIFERINSTGTRLGVVDFMRALTWSDDFDLTKELLTIVEDSRQSGFDFEDETILKAMGIVCGLSPLPDVLMTLRNKSSSELHSAVKTLERVLLVATTFVSENTGIANSDALPYEAQWLLLFRLVSEGIQLDGMREAILRWVRVTSFSEALQGRPDHVLARMIDDQVSQIRASGDISIPRVNVGLEDVIFKRFLRGKAMSVSFVSLLVERGVFEERPLSTIPYEDFVSIVNADVLGGAFSRESRYARTIGNVVYLPGQKRRPFRGTAAFIEMIDSLDDKDEVFLSRQFLGAEVIELLRLGKMEEALRARANEIVIKASA